MVKNLSQMTFDIAQAYKEGWNDALEEARKIVLAIDTNRSNEKEIAKAIDGRKMKL